MIKLKKIKYPGSDTWNPYVRHIYWKNKQVGYLELIAQEKICFIRELCIDDKFQGLGIGSDVVRILKKYGKNQYLIAEALSSSRKFWDNQIAAHKGFKVNVTYHDDCCRTYIIPRSDTNKARMRRDLGRNDQIYGFLERNT